MTPDRKPHDRRRRLLDAYRATSYQADVEGETVRLRVARETPELDARLAGWNLDSWAFLTAANPGSLPLSDEENRARHEELVNLLAGLGCKMWQGLGVADDDGWSPEVSLLVPGLCRDEAIRIGRRFGQVAVVFGRVGEAAELVESDGETRVA